MTSCRRNDHQDLVVGLFMAWFHAFFYDEQAKQACWLADFGEKSDNLVAFSIPKCRRPVKGCWPGPMMLPAFFVERVLDKI